MAKQSPVAMEELFALKPRAIWRQFKSEHWSFWMICGYLFVEYVRPQSIIPALNFLPWASVFLLLSFIGAIFDPTVKWVKSSANKWMVLYLVVIFASIIDAPYKDWSYRKIDWIYTWVIIYFLIINIVNTPKRVFIFLSVFVVASFKISLGLAIIWAKRGFAFSSWGLQGPPGFFTNSGELAIQMCVFFPIAYVISIRLKPYVSRWVGYILALMPITAVMVVLGASSRGAQLALAAQLIFMFYKKIFRLKTLIPLIVVIATAFYFLPDEQKHRFGDAGEDKTSQQRLLYWKHGIDMILDHPVLGVGYFNFPPYYAANFGADMLYENAQLPHNIFIQVGTDAGFVGLSIFLLLIWNTVRINALTASYCRGLEEGRVFGPLAWSLNIALLGFLVAGQFVTVTYYPFVWINLSLTVAMHWSISSNVKSKRPSG